MRVNEPITNTEVELQDNELLVSRTDKGGRITFVNAAFAKISGYSEEELIGAPHNLVRHPHMPVEAFADLWRTVKSGRPWEGLVKNRTKTGDYYWVRANVTPVMENGEVKEFISIRFKPTRAQIKAHEALYAAFRDGAAQGQEIRGGAAVPIGWRYGLRTFIDSIKGRLVGSFGVAGLIILLVGTLGCLGANPSTIGVTTLVGLAAYLFLGQLLLAKIRSPLQRFGNHLEAIARSDFTHDISAEPASEFEALTVLLRALKAKLAYADQERSENERKLQIERQRAQDEMAENARVVHSAAQEIAGAVEGQAATSAEMSSSVAEITSTMEELSASSSKVAEHSQSVVDMADRTWENSKEGADAMRAMLDRMEEIRTDNHQSLCVIEELGKKSKEISKIMHIIESVADQTKLIAFNAALEASSAGDAGKRFSVVAAEIRRLADNVTGSAGEIADKVGEIQDAISHLVVTAEKGAERIEAGMGESSRVADILGGLEHAAHESSTAAQQISLATQQQRTASGQVVVALREIVDASSQTAGAIVRISDVARNMTSLSKQLETLVGKNHEHSPPSRADV